ncbi:MAG: phosphoenolpyruvate carboxykinase (GTP), partial [Brevundimonas sp.]
EAVDTPVGRVPSVDALDLSGLTLSDADLSTLLTVDADVWAEEAALIPDFYATFGDRLPKALWDQHAALTARIEDSRAAAIAAE